jgi:hypothetical protein
MFAGSIPDVIVGFFNLPNPSSRTKALGSTQYPTEMSTRNLPGGKKRPALRADNLATICEPNVLKCGSLDFSQTCGPSRPVTGIALPFYHVLTAVRGEWQRMTWGASSDTIFVSCFEKHCQIFQEVYWRDIQWDAKQTDISSMVTL